MTVSTFEAAKKVCALGDWRVTNLKLQKLLYLAHMVYLGRYGEPLVSELFEAWEYGPVLPSLYRKVKAFGNQPIGDVFSNVSTIDDSREATLIEEACQHYLHKRAAELVSITHRDSGAWARNYEPFIRGNQIPNNDIIEEYRALTSGSSHHDAA